MAWRCVVCGAWYDEHLPSCVSCLDGGTIIRPGRRPGAVIDAAPEVTTAAALAKAAWTPVLSASYPELRLGVGALVVVFGPPGGGKSTYATRMLDGFRAPVVLQSIEEAPGPSLHARLRRCHVIRDDFTIVGRASVDQLADLVRSARAMAVGIDSVQMAAFTPEDLRHFLLVVPNLRVVVAIAQVNKEGRIEGRERLLHEADVAVRCEGLRWTVTKSRYQAGSIGGDVLPQGGEVTHAAP